MNSFKLSEFRRLLLQLRQLLLQVLLAGAFLASGMFWSSVTRDQIVAMLAALVTLLILRLIGAPTFLESIASGAPTWVVDVLSGISPYKYFSSMARGVIDTRDIVYFCCFCGFFLYANALVLHARREVLALDFPEPLTIQALAFALGCMVE